MIFQTFEANDYLSISFEHKIMKLGEILWSNQEMELHFLRTYQQVPSQQEKEKKLVFSRTLYANLLIWWSSENFQNINLQ